MKYIKQKTIIVVGLLLIYTINVHAQQSPGQQLSQKIAQKMKDTLQLTERQRSRIYNYNMQLFYAKQTIRQSHAGSDSLGYFIQRIENKRDSLYKTILPEEKFLQYKKKKRNLVSN